MTSPITSTTTSIGMINRRTQNIWLLSSRRPESVSKSLHLLYYHHFLDLTITHTLNYYYKSWQLTPTVRLAWRFLPSEFDGQCFHRILKIRLCPSVKTRWICVPASVQDSSETRRRRRPPGSCCILDQLSARGVAICIKIAGTGVRVAFLTTVSRWLHHGARLALPVIPARHACWMIIPWSTEKFFLSSLTRIYLFIDRAN
jgi:hypothetical protein